MHSGHGDYLNFKATYSTAGDAMVWDDLDEVAPVVSWDFSDSEANGGAISGFSSEDAQAPDEQTGDDKEVRLADLRPPVIRGPISNFVETARRFWWVLPRLASTYG